MEKKAPQWKSLQDEKYLLLCDRALLQKKEENNPRNCGQQLIVVRSCIASKNLDLSLCPYTALNMEEVCHACRCLGMPTVGKKGTVRERIRCSWEVPWVAMGHGVPPWSQPYVRALLLHLPRS